MSYAVDEIVPRAVNLLTGKPVAFPAIYTVVDRDDDLDICTVSGVFGHDIARRIAELLEQHGLIDTETLAE